MALARLWLRPRCSARSIRGRLTKQLMNTHRGFWGIVLPAAILFFIIGTRAVQRIAEGAVHNASDAASETRAPLEAQKASGTLMGMHYETWFTPKNVSWQTSEAVPILGKYSSYDVNVVKKHEEWFEDLGIDWLLVDWSNMLWMKPAWEEQTGGVRELEETTQLLFDTYERLAEEGRHPPKIVLLLGLQNGPDYPEDGIRKLSKVFDWINAHFLANPRYKDRWLYYGGKPLIVVWYSPYDACQRLFRGILKQHPLDEPQWTIRWMNQQLEISHTQDCGMWSWIDCPIRQQVTYLAGKAEHTVVTPACFPPGGWLAAGAVLKDHGASYLESWKVAFESRPRFIAINQWNEFFGQKEGQGYGPDHHQYMDEYDLAHSDDLEPTQLEGCAYRGCGGWGYYYMNLTKALISLYRGATPGITVLALSGTTPPKVVRTKLLPLSWVSVGKPPDTYTLEVDKTIVAEGVRGDSYRLDLSRIRPGTHTLTLIGTGVHTYFDLRPDKLTQRSAQPLPVTSTVEFRYAPGGTY